MGSVRGVSGHPGGSAAIHHGATATADPIGDILGDIPLPPYVTGEDVQFAVRAVVVHAPRPWPAGAVCGKDGAPHPCRLHRWGRRVLALSGIRAADVEMAVLRGGPDSGGPR